MVIIEGIVEEIIFCNEDNGYVVCDVNCNEELITAVGFMPYINPGEFIKFSGEWGYHKDYGKQFKVEYFELRLPESEEDIYKFLASGAIKGIREATAQKIVSTFGKDSLKVIEEDPSMLSKIKGISPKRAKEIGQSYSRQSRLKSIVLFFQEFGIGTNAAVKVFKAYGEEAVSKIKENPYILVKEIDRIGFKVADKIAMGLGFHTSYKERIKAGIVYLLYQYSTEGHTYLPYNILIDKSVKLMEVEVSEVENALTALDIENQVVIENTENIYLKSLFIAEQNVANKLKFLNSFSFDDDTNEKEIRIVEKDMGIELEKQQFKAVTEALNNNLTVITGGPGTGKTTIIKIIISILEKKQMKVELAAPTGRAAKKMSELTGREAKTIHRLLEIGYIDDLKELKFKKDEFNPIKADAIIIDELSMVDINLMNHFLKAVAPNTRLIMIGDKDQLPSVGPGNIIKDIINSEVLKIIKLTRIFRQAKESMIVVNAHRINNGEYPQLNKKDFYFIPKKTAKDTVETVIDVCTKRLPDKYGYVTREDIQVLAPMKKTVVGIKNLNIKLQETINPKSNTKNEKLFRDFFFREGDKVMQIKNNYNKQWESIHNDEIGTGVFNGDIGYINRINKKREYIEVIFDEDKRMVYDFNELNELDLAYALTIHKSQGSEFKVVVIPLLYGPPMLLTRNLIYTAVTRASEMVVIIGSERIVRKMVDNNKEIKRFTGLYNKLIVEGEKNYLSI